MPGSRARPCESVAWSNQAPDYSKDTLAFAHGRAHIWINTSKRKLMMFVTNHLISPGGQPVNSNQEIEESEDVIEPSSLPEVADVQEVTA